MTERADYLPHYDEADRALAAKLEKVRFLADGVPFSVPTMETYTVSLPVEGRRFLHEAAMIEYRGTLFAAWYNCPLEELKGETPIRFARSFDGGKSWSDPVTVITDGSGAFLYCPPVFGICEDKLYMLVNEMSGPDLMHALLLYVWDAATDGFVRLWSRPVPFKLNTNVVQLPNGKLLLPGRIGEPEDVPYVPAVMISDSGKIDAPWRVVQVSETRYVTDVDKLHCPESGVILCGGKLYFFCRNDKRRVPLVYVSADMGETWTAPMAHDIPAVASKIYTGTLSDGRNYVICNIPEDAPTRLGRSKLALYLSLPNSMTFDRCLILKNSLQEEGPYAGWHYPCAIESEGRLKIICTASYKEAGEPRAAMLLDVEI